MSNRLSTSSPTVVYIEDDVRLGQLTAAYLEREGVLVSVENEPRAGIARVLKTRPDVVLLDVNLPELSGFEVCALLRERTDIPIVMVTARTMQGDRVAGLEGGADDYIVKPFDPRELLARIRAQTRRHRHQVGPPDDELCVGPFKLLPKRREAFLREERLELTTYEFDLFHTLMRSAGEPLTREHLVDAVRGNAEEAFDRSIDVHVSNLRRKLGDTPRSPRWLKTVRGVGYVLVKD